MFKPVPQSYPTSLDFTNLFSRLKNIHSPLEPKSQSQIPISRSHLKTRSLSTSAQKNRRPKSMYICREKQNQSSQKMFTPMRHSSYQRKWFSSEKVKDVGFKTRCFTEGYEKNSQKQPQTQKSTLFKFKLVNNFCLKKIMVASENQHPLQPKESKATIKNLMMNFQETNQKSYQKKTLRTYKRSKMIRNISRPNDISARVEGHKIF